MRLRLTLVTGHATTEPVVVDAAPGDTVGDLVGLLVGEGRIVPGSRLHVADAALAATDLVGMPPLLDGAVVRVSAGGRPGRAPRRGPASLVRLEVVGGPDAGASHPLTPGLHRIGRGADCELSVADPHLSRVHAEVEVTSRGLTLTDVSSTNAVLRVAADGSLSPIGRGALTVGDQVRIGSTTLAVRAGRPRAVPGRAGGDGTVTVSRTTSGHDGWRAVTLTRPAPPAPVTQRRLPWVQVLLPLPVCVVLAWLWGPQMLVFALLGPLLAGGTAVSDRVGARRSARTEGDRHTARLAEHDAVRHDAVAAERAHLLGSHPDAASVLAIGSTPSTRLWERTGDAPDGLVVRVGSGAVRGASREVSAGGAAEPEHLRLPEAPVTLDLGRLGSLGIGGDPDLVARTGTWLVVQLATLVAPGTLSIDVLGAGPEWDWVRLLPHAHPDGVDLVEAHRSRDGASNAVAAPSLPPAVVLIPDGAMVAGTPGLSDLVAGGASRGVHVVVLDPGGHGLPAGLGAVLHVDREPSEVLLSIPADPGATRIDGDAGLLLDGLDPTRGEQVARALAPYRVAGTGPEGALPTRVSLAHVHGDPTVEDVLATWEQRGGPVAVVGADAAGPMTLDLRRDGPHALVGGMTGAGKSELLRTLVAGLALASAPEDLAFVLVDYKGGAAFGELADLPHVAALVTDLDADLVERALVSLTAELRRRERVLAATGAPDLEEHLRRGGERLPRLVIVVDELRALVDELPAFVQGLVRIASLGRSLGVHLVLATQRPAGVVSADIAANVNLRIALRVRDRVDSEAIVGSPRAAALPASAPGRAIAAVAGGETTFQSALVTPDECPEPPLTVTGAGWTAVGAPRPLPARRQTGLADVIREAARTSGRPPAVPPWQPPLPRDLRWDELEREAGSLPLGMVDVPEEQRTDLLTWRPDDGHLAVVGAPRSGRTSTLATVIGAVVADELPWHVHVLATGHALSGLGAATSVGSVVSLHDRELLGRFVERLEAGVRDRRDGGPAAADRPRVLVAVDGWDVLAGAPTDLAGHELVERLLSVLRDGLAVGVHAVATGGRSLVQGRTGERFARRLALGSLDAGEALHLGLPPSAAGRDRPPGRGVDVRSGRLCQLARHGGPGPGPTGPATPHDLDEDVRAVLALDRARARPHGMPAPFRVEHLPTTVTRERLRGDHGAIGLDADLSPVGFGPEDLHVLVAGPRRSGRSTALRALARSWAAAGRPVLLVARPSMSGTGAERPSGQPVALPEGVTAFDPREVDAIAAALREDPSTALLVDDVDHVADRPLEQLVLDAVATAALRGTPVAVGADSGALVTAFRGAAVQVAARRTGLLLGARGAADGDLLGVRVRGPREAVPGRGFLVRDGTAVLVQVVTDERAERSAGQASGAARPPGEAETADRTEPTARTATPSAMRGRPD